MNKSQTARNAVMSASATKRCLCISVLARAGCNCCYVCIALQGATAAAGSVVRPASASAAPPDAISPRSPRRALSGGAQPQQPAQSAGHAARQQHGSHAGAPLPPHQQDRSDSPDKTGADLCPALPPPTCTGQTSVWRMSIWHVLSPLLI